MATLNDLQAVYQYLELSRLKMFNLISQNIALERLKESGNKIAGVPGGKVQWNGHILKITVPDFIPSKKATGELEGELFANTRDYWRTMIFSLYKSLERDVFFNKAHCHIITFLPYNDMPWDVDNRVYKFVIDGVRSCRIVKDDSYQYLEFSVSGDIDKENPRTEIFVFEASYLDLYKQLNKGF